MEVAAQVRWTYTPSSHMDYVSDGVVELSGGPFLSSLEGCDDWEVSVITAGRLMLGLFSRRAGKRT